MSFSDSVSEDSFRASKRIIATPGPDVQKAFFFIQEIGQLKCLKSYRSERSLLDSYLMIIVLSGSGIIHYQNRDLHLKAGDCAWIDCHSPYFHESDPYDLWEICWIHFKGATTAEYYHIFAERNSPCFHPADLAIFANPINMLYKLHSDQPPHYELFSSRILVELMTDILANEGQAAIFDSQTCSKLMDIKTFLDVSFKDHISLDDLAGQFFISKFYLCREFKEMYGISINQYLTQKRISRAKELLRFSANSVQEIAAECGIPDANYFNKVFKKLENMTATEYRNSWKT